LPVVPTTKWPTVLGVIAIILGVLGALGAAFTILSYGMLTRLAGAGGGGAQLQAQIQTQMEQTRGWAMICSAVELGVAVLLVAAGVGLVNRRRWGVSAARAWAIIKMAWVVVRLVVGWQSQQMAFQSNPAFGGPNAGFMRAMQAVGVVVSLVWGWALPVVMLVWLSRSKSKAEVATWK
jgi:hypothetical protein